uniref:Uncharacterized protein n=1 Tax=Sphaerodactylus townsendi TaxID=933632 RepID=A0ACB8G1U8_9SAUR
MAPPKDTKVSWLSLQQTQSCRWTVFMLTGAKEDQRQDEFLKERKETAELADPKATKVVPVQCQAVPEVGGVSCCATPGVPVQLSDVPGRAVPREISGAVPVREKEAVANASQRAPVVQLNKHSCGGGVPGKLWSDSCERRKRRLPMSA